MSDLPKEGITAFESGIDALLRKAGAYTNPRAKQLGYESVVSAITAFAMENEEGMTAGLFLYRGFVLNELGRFDEALVAYNESLRLDPTNAAAWNNLGFAHIGRGQYGEAIGPLEKATGIDPAHAAAWHNLGDARIMLGQYDKAVEAYTESIRLNPNDVTAWNNLGFAHIGRGQYGEAVEACNKALRSDPSNPYPYKNRAQAMAGQGHKTRAVRKWLKAAFDHATGENTGPQFWNSLFQTLLGADGTPVAAEKTLRRWSGRPSVWKPDGEKPADMSPAA